MAIIDADAHVIESVATWEHMVGDDEQYKPIPVISETDGKPFWVIDGVLRARRVNVGTDTTKASQELTDVPARVADLDKFGTDIQVLYPSLWTSITFKHTEADQAVCKGYNRFMADVCSQAPDRLRWIAVLPASNIDAAIEELHYAKAHGGCGATFRGWEGEHHPTSPYFFPMYEEAERLGLPMCFHAGIGNDAVNDFLMGAPDRGNMQRFKWPVMAAFHSLLLSDVSTRFPELRFGFIEASAGWIPYILGDLTRRVAWTQGNINDSGPTSQMLKDNNLFVTCQTNDDLPYVLKFAGDDNLIIGTDYGHADTATELLALRTFQENSGVSPEATTKILDANARALYGL
jgi:predicted TIM-barrel fold metal-dependent hydrolase